MLAVLGDTERLRSHIAAIRAQWSSYLEESEVKSLEKLLDSSSPANWEKFITLKDAAKYDNAFVFRVRSMAFDAALNAPRSGGKSMEESQSNSMFLTLDMGRERYFRKLYESKSEDRASQQSERKSETRRSRSKGRDGSNKPLSRELRELLPEAEPVWNFDSEAKRKMYHQLDKVLTELKGHKDHSYPFLTKVKKADAPDYYDVIENPMDLSLMTKKLREAEYPSKTAFAQDLSLMFSNCRQFNQDPDSIFVVHADEMEKLADKLMKDVDDYADENEEGTSQGEIDDDDDDDDVSSVSFASDDAFSVASEVEIAREDGNSPSPPYNSRLALSSVRDVVSERVRYLSAAKVVERAFPRSFAAKVPSLDEISQHVEGKQGVSCNGAFDVELYAADCPVLPSSELPHLNVSHWGEVEEEKPQNDVSKDEKRGDGDVLVNLGVMGANIDLLARVKPILTDSSGEIDTSMDMVSEDFFARLSEADDLQQLAGEIKRFAQLRKQSKRLVTSPPEAHQTIRDTVGITIAHAQFHAVRRSALDALTDVVDDFIATSLRGLKSYAENAWSRANGAHRVVSFARSDSDPPIPVKPLSEVSLAFKFLQDARIASVTDLSRYLKLSLLSRHRSLSKIASAIQSQEKQTSSTSSGIRAALQAPSHTIPAVRNRYSVLRDSLAHVKPLADSGISREQVAAGSGGRVETDGEAEALAKTSQELALLDADILQYMNGPGIDPVENDTRPESPEKSLPDTSEAASSDMQDDPASSPVSLPDDDEESLTPDAKRQRVEGKKGGARRSRATRSGKK